MSSDLNYKAVVSVVVQSSPPIRYRAEFNSEKFLEEDFDLNELKKEIRAFFIQQLERTKTSMEKKHWATQDVINALKKSENGEADNPLPPDLAPTSKVSNPKKGS